jgi:hypothetical protein
VCVCVCVCVCFGGEGNTRDGCGHSLLLVVENNKSSQECVGRDDDERAGTVNVTWQTASPGRNEDGPIDKGLTVAHVVRRDNLVRPTEGNAWWDGDVPDKLEEARTNPHGSTAKLGSGSKSLSERPRVVR